MTIASRTPEGDPNRCPVCGHALRLEPSWPSGDAPCPSCGSLLWFAPATAAAQPGPAREGPRVPTGAGGRVRVKVRDGTFAGMEGEVKELLEAKGLVRVELTVFGRPVPVELEPGQVEAVA
jgi:hypothetical protein